MKRDIADIAFLYLASTKGYVGQTISPHHVCSRIQQFTLRNKPEARRPEWRQEVISYVQRKGGAPQRRKYARCPCLLVVWGGSYRGITVMRDWLILFSVKREFNKLFFVIRDLKVLRDPWRTWIINRYSWFHHSIWRDFEMRVLRKTYFKTENIKCDK